MGMIKYLSQKIKSSKPYKAVLNSMATSLPYNKIVEQYHVRAEAGNGVATYKRQAISYQAKEIKDWVQAVQAATDPDRPRRSLLYRFYQNMLIDDHLQSTIDKRVLPLQQESFRIVDDNDNENEDLKKLLERPWLHEVMQLFIMSKLQGPTLVKFGDLNEEMEISSVEEIPQSNFIPQDGVILREEFDDTGVSYKDGALANYLFQFGHDWSLGMLNELAIIILAKKLGMGSWMSYIEKYGIPPIFAITERLDQKRRDELFEMLSDFSSNHFAVLQGNEKVEVGKENAKDGKDAFSPLLERGDRQITRRILGQTGTTSNEAYVGTAEVHERVEETLHIADKMLFKYYFNSVIKGKLAKISPAYSAFEKYHLEWNEAESLSMEEYIKAIVELGDMFEFDPEEVKAKTGLPIIGKKEAAATPVEPTPPKPDTTKKKVSTTAEIDESPIERERGITITMGENNFNGIIERVMQKVYEQKVETGAIDQELFLETYKQLNKAAEEGWGGGYTDHDSDNADTAQTMRENLFQFSGAKTYQQLKEFNEKLFDENGDKRSFNDFKKDVLYIHKEYNESYLATEYDTAMSSAQMAEKWAGYQANKKVFPNLMYVAVNDQNTRPEHSLLDGTIKPVDDPFWSVNYPPNGWNCRCHVEPTTENTTEGSPSIDIDYRFAQNVGKTGTTFVPTHPYFSIPKKDLKKVDKEVELQKAFAPYHTDKKSSVKINDFANKGKLKDNLKAARTISSKLDMNVSIRPHIDVEGVDNPAYIIKDKLGDSAMLSNQKSDIVNALKTAQKQNCEYSVMIFDRLSKLNKQQLNKQLTAIEKSGKFNDINMLLVKGENAVKLSFKDISKGDHENTLKEL